MLQPISVVTSLSPRATQDNVKAVFEEVVQKILETPALLTGTGPASNSRAGVARLDVPRPAAPEANSGMCC